MAVRSGRNCHDAQRENDRITTVCGDASSCRFGFVSIDMLWRITLSIAVQAATYLVRPHMYPLTPQFLSRPLIVSSAV